MIGGVLIGEGLYGWTTVADTTDWRYWAVELLIGVAITTAASARSQYPRHVLPTMAAAISTAAVVFAFYRLAGGASVAFHRHGFADSNVGNQVDDGSEDFIARHRFRRLGSRLDL